MKLIPQAICLASSLIFVGCGGKTAPPAPPSATTNTAKAKPETQVYYVRGVVKGLKLEEQTVLVDHEEIPGFMEKMTMPFTVADTNEFDGISTNDLIHFRLVVEPLKSWIDQVNKTGTAQSLTNQNRPMFRPVREVEALSEGDMLPNYPFTNSFGKPFQTDQHRGKVLALTLIFTRCPLPDFCPRMSQNFNAMYHTLIEDTSGFTNWHLLSLSFDPEFDTPMVLKSYAQRFNRNPEKWSFATGALIELDDITERFGMYFARESTGVTFNHNLRTVIIDPHGRVHKILIGNTWKPDEAVAAMKAAASAKAPAAEKKE